MILIPQNENFLQIEKEQLEKTKFYIQNSKSKNTKKVIPLTRSFLLNGVRIIIVHLSLVMSARFAYTFLN